MRSQHIFEDHKVKTGPTTVKPEAVQIGYSTFKQSLSWGSETKKVKSLLELERKNRAFLSKDSKKTFLDLLRKQNFPACSKFHRAKPIIGITLVLSSSVDKNVRISFHLLKSLLANMISQIIFTRQIMWSQPFNEYSVKGKGKNLQKSPEFYHTTSQTPPLQLDSALVRREAVKTLRTSRSLGASLELTTIPQSVKLFTVIRSPHVFKKTREQFASNLSKRALSLSFWDRSTAQLFLESLTLLKLPVETKIFLKD